MIIRYSKKLFPLLAVILFLCVCSGSAYSSSSIQVSDSELGLLIKNRLNGWDAPARKVIGGEQIYAAVLVQSFYKGRNYQPAWSQNGRLMQVETLIKAVEESYDDGLTPDYYHLATIKSLAAKGERELSRDPARLADLDILLTDAFLALGCHLSAGCVDPVTLETEWFAKSGHVDVSSILQQAIAQKQIREALTRLRPSDGSYISLRKALAVYRGLLSRGEWPLVSNGPALKKNSLSDRVPELRKRLAASGDLKVTEAKGGDLFDDQLEQSVILFQKRHGLKADGVVGPMTLDALNVTLKQRVRQIELNLERLRWILGSAERRAIVVNIADFKLELIENGKSVLTMKVVVGKPYLSTPIFTAKMTYFIINPPWNVPASIARKDILKEIKRDPHYLAKQKIKVFSGWGPHEKEIDPEKIDWSQITGKTLTYRFRQEPGRLNALGRLKFMFPNKFDVYLHDTPARSLFSADVRTFSHGCIRIEKPIELAEYLMKDDPHWTRENLLAAVEKGDEKTILIPHPINVNFLYLTAWVDDAGVLQFRNDIYGRDGLLDEALRKKLPLQ